jgi:hypothetical protein
MIRTVVSMFLGAVLMLGALGCAKKTEPPTTPSGGTQPSGRIPPGGPT